MVDYNSGKKYITGIWGDDFACIGSIETLLKFEGMLLDNLEARRIGIVGPGYPGHVELLNLQDA
jgi:hypothetical protein